MNAPRVTICGRPNVGKSSLFNAIVRRRIAIVDPTAGVTRDRVSSVVERQGRRFQLIDTGGMGLFDETLLKDEVERQIGIALGEADLVLFCVDARDGLLPADAEIARRLRPLGKPVLLVANKCDGPALESDLGAFFRLGMGEPVPVSATERLGVEELVERVLDLLPERGAAPDEGGDSSEPIRLAIVGKVNSGKSTLVNLLCGEDRVIVSDLPGTTRDAIDAPFERGGRRFIAVDTAGLRKRRAVEGTADFYGQGRAQAAVRRADVVLLLVDATRDISKIDKGLAHLIARSEKPVVIGVTKWDLAAEAGRTPEDYIPYVEQQLPQLDFAPVSFFSALGDFNVDETLEVCASLYDQAGYRAATGPLNRVIEDAVSRHAPRVTRSQTPKVLYATQIGVRPPTFVVFVNESKLFGEEYRRYLANRLREAFPFDEVPLRILFRSRS